MLTPEQLKQLDEAEGRIIVAYSGGCDSHVLLHYLWQNLARSVEALHINHGIDPKADDWQLHCETVCDELQIPMTSFAVTVSRSGSLETNAREARYLVFERFLEPGDKLLFAHHQDDQIETLLLNLTSGRAPLGLLGMPEQRVLGAGTIDRPMLHVTQAQIREYATESYLRWIEDPSNSDTAHTRNLIRHEILPNLRQHWPDINEKLGQAWANTESLMSALETQGQQDLRDVQLGKGLLDLVGLAALPKSRRSACLRKLLESLGYQKTLGQNTLDEMSKVLLEEPAGFDLGAWYLQSHAGKLYICLNSEPEAEPIQSHEGLQIFSSGVLSNDILKGRGINLPANQLTCRVRTGGEAIILRGHHHKLKNLFQEQSIPPHIRDHIPLIYLEDLCVGIVGIPEWGIPMLVAEDYQTGPEQFGCELGWTPAGLG